MKNILFEDSIYPYFQTLGNASQFAIPFAKHFCRGLGYDVGCYFKEWAFPGAIPIDINFDDEYHALNLPEEEPDYIFSSHCLEHTDDWVEVMNYWTHRLKIGGVLFLYLPDFSQKYWRPWNNRKHKHCFTSEIIYEYMKKKYENIFVSGIDLNNSFIIVGEKK